MIERFARMLEADLPDFAVPYCRRVTLVWCGFFVAHAACAALLALAAPLSWWVLYTGIVFYALLAGLVLGEVVLRKIWFRYYGDGVGDRLLARILPAEHTARGRRSLAYVAARATRQREAGTQS